MEVIILAHEKDIGDGEDKAGSDQVCPMCRYRVGAKVDESQRDGQLLVRMLAVGLTMICMLQVLLSKQSSYHIQKCRIRIYSFTMANNRYIPKEPSSLANHR